MAKIHARNSSFYVDDSSGASQALTGDLNQITLTWTHGNAEVTTFGNDTVQRISSLRDVTLKGTAIWNSGTTQAPCVLNGLMSGSSISRIQWFPAGSGNTACKFYTGCMLIDSYEEVGPVGGPVAVSFSFQMAAGSLSASTT